MLDGYDDRASLRVNYSRKRYLRDLSRNTAYRLDGGATLQITKPKKYENSKCQSFSSRIGAAGLCWRWRW